MLRRYGNRREEPVSYREPDGWFTALLHAGLLVLAFVLAAISSYFVSFYAAIGQDDCFFNPLCDTGPFVIASRIVPFGSLLAFVLSGVVSVILLARRRPAWFIPVGAAVAMVLCLVAALVIASSATQASG